MPNLYISAHFAKLCRVGKYTLNGMSNIGKNAGSIYI